MAMARDKHSFISFSGVSAVNGRNLQSSIYSLASINTRTAKRYGFCRVFPPHYCDRSGWSEHGPFRLGAEQTDVIRKLTARFSHARLTTTALAPAGWMVYRRYSSLWFSSGFTVKRIAPNAGL